MFHRQCNGGRVGHSTLAPCRGLQACLLAFGGHWCGVILAKSFGNGHTRVPGIPTG